MRCIITGVETENKWKNRPVSTAAIKAARKYQEREPNLNLHQALKRLDKDFTEMLSVRVAEMENNVKVTRGNMDAV